MDGCINDLYKSHRGKVSDKWQCYINAYDTLFERFKEKQLSLLEIGIQNGGSLEIWAKYFPNATSLIGCDINTKCSDLKYDNENITVLVGDIKSTAIFAELSTMRFDIIIDDGSHTSSDIITTFLKFFPLLNNGGVYIVEDLHCSYWQAFEGGLYHPYSSMSFFKKLVDILNVEHWGVPISNQQFFDGMVKHYNLSPIDDCLDLSKIASIQFKNSLCIIEKSYLSNSLGDRIFAGADDSIVPIPAHANVVSTASPPSQVANKYANRTIGFDEENFRADETIELLRADLTQARKENYELKKSTSWRLTQPMRQLAQFIRKCR